MLVLKTEEKKIYVFRGSVASKKAADPAVEEKPEDYAEVEVAYKIPTAAEAENILSSQTKDSAIFEKYVTSIKSNYIQGWGDGVTPDQVIAARGTYGLIHLIAVDIVDSMRVDFRRKK